MRSHLLSSSARSNFAAIRPRIEYVDPATIKLTRRRIHKQRKSQIRKLAAHIARFGMIMPIMVDDEMALAESYLRYDAACYLKLPEVPVIRISHLTPEEIELFRIFESKIAEEIEWDEEALVLIFDELQLGSEAIELTDSGFSIAEIDRMKGRSRTEELNDLDDASEPDSDQPSVSRFGDLWICGRHRLLCGDSTNPESLELLLQGAKAQQSITDPPYGLPTRFFSSSKKHGDFAQGAGEHKGDEFQGFLARFLSTAAPHLGDGALVYAFMDWRHIDALIAAGRQAGLEYVQLLVWAKHSAGLGSLYRSGHELIGVFKYGSAPARNNIELGKHGRNRSNVLNYPGVMTTGGRTKALAMHPTVKNVAMIADLMLDASAPGDAILDCFGGSGTTMIAAEKTDRTAYLCELSPGYVDVALRRWCDLGTGAPVLAATGQTFNEVRAERLASSSEEAA